MLSITSIRLDGSNFAQWAQAVEVFLLGQNMFKYLTNDPPPIMDSKFSDWRAKDTQIQGCLWSSMESKISCSSVFLPTAKLVWKQA